VKRAGREQHHLPEEFGLARHTLPEGKLIDRIALDVLPVGEPCWVPGRRSEILFVAGNGAIYRYRFEGGDQEPEIAPGTTPWEPAQPRRVSWRTTPPSAGLVSFRDVVWPADPRLGGRLIGSIWWTTGTPGEKKMVGSQLWWFELGADGMGIEAAGPLILPDAVADADPAANAGEDPEDRLPNVGTTAEGEPLLAYLHRSRGESTWELRLARISVDPRTGIPAIHPGETVRLSQGCMATTPAFALDGQSIFSVLASDVRNAETILRRFSVARAAAVFSPTRLVQNASGRHSR
jgi:hypothetical protein